jgi:alpha-tubulin suppressor-like RCC1 family protein
MSFATPATSGSRITAWIHTRIHTFAGQVYACGCNSYGQLGNGTSRKSSTPQLIPLPGKIVTNVACSYHHTVLVTSDGEAYAFGLNDHGQLGIDSTKNSSTPELVKLPAGVRVVAASCGQHHTVLLTDDGCVYSCGRNHNGQLGLGTRDGCNAPQLVSSLKGLHVTQIACGYNHTCALVLQKKEAWTAGADETVLYTFGYNHHGQLGLGNGESSAVPQIVQDLKDVRIVKVRACMRLVCCGYMR